MSSPSAFTPGDENRIDVRLDWIHVRRNEKTRLVGALLVDVVHDLRMPEIVERVHRHLRLDLRERIPIAVVVVARVVMVEHGHVRSFRRSAEGAAIPVADNVDAVGVERRHHQHDRLRADRARLRILPAHEPVREHERREDAAHLIRVNAGRDEDDQLPIGNQRVALARATDARIGESPLDLAVLRQIRDRGRVGNDGGDERAAERRLAERMELDARTRLRERCEVRDHLRPRRELAIGAGNEPDHRRRRRNVRGRLRAKHRWSGECEAERHAPQRARETTKRRSCAARRRPRARGRFRGRGRALRRSRC